MSRSGSQSESLQQIVELWRDRQFTKGAVEAARLWKESSNPLALVWRARCLNRLKRDEEALAILRQIETSRSLPIWFWTLYADLLSGGGFTEDACKQLSMGLDNTPEPKREQLFERLATLYRELGRWSEAAAVSERARVWQAQYKPYGRLTVLQKLIDALRAKRYLEIGVNDGETFLKLSCSLKHAVDPCFRIPGGFFDTDSERWFQLTSDEYFESQEDWLGRNLLDLVFVDGLHTYEQSLRDVDNALKYLRPGGLIVMHDCLPTSKAAAAPTIAEARAIRKTEGKAVRESAWMGDVYRAVLHLRSFYPHLDVCVLDSDCGLGFVRVGTSDSMLSLSLKEIQEFSYDDLVADKAQLLNLKDEKWFDELIVMLEEANRQPR